MKAFLEIVAALARLPRRDDVARMHSGFAADAQRSAVTTHTPFSIRLRRQLAVAATSLVVFGVAGCAASVHVSVGSATVDHPGQLVSNALAQSVGHHPVSVSCPSDIPAKVGHVFHCHVVIDSAGHYVVATVRESSVHGSSVHVDISDGTHVYASN